MMQKAFSTAKTAPVGLFLLRVSVGVMMISFHGLEKLMHFREMQTDFPDPLGIGHPFSLLLAVFAEFFCSIALILGFQTRLVALPLLITMLVAAFVHQQNDPWKARELALLYLSIFGALVLCGGGAFAVDGKSK